MLEGAGHQKRLAFSISRKLVVLAFQTLAAHCSKVRSDEGFSMRAIARVFGAGLTLARVDKPLKEEAVGCQV